MRVLDSCSRAVWTRACTRARRSTHSTPRVLSDVLIPKMGSRTRLTGTHGMRNRVFERTLRRPKQGIEIVSVLDQTLQGGSDPSRECPSFSVFSPIASFHTYLLTYSTVLLKHSWYSTYLKCRPERTVLCCSAVGHPMLTFLCRRAVRFVP